MTLSALKESALRLSAAEKAELIDALWEDLGPTPWRQAAPAWAIEAEQRVDAVDSGELPLIDGEDGFKLLQDSLPSE